MREIIFRGKRIDTGEWVEGNLFQFRERTEIFPINGTGMVESQIVDPETVGQYTGLKDKNGKSIFEGDILGDDEFTGWEWRGVIKFSHGVFGAEWLPNIETQSMVGSWGQRHNLRKLDDDIIGRKIVIGNIHDNPELLK